MCRGWQRQVTEQGWHFTQIGQGTGGDGVRGAGQGQCGAAGGDCGSVAAIAATDGGECQAAEALRVAVQVKLRFRADGQAVGVVDLAAGEQAQDGIAHGQRIRGAIVTTGEDDILVRACTQSVARTRHVVEVQDDTGKVGGAGVKVGVRQGDVLGVGEAHAIDHQGEAAVGSTTNLGVDRQGIGTLMDEHFWTRRVDHTTQRSGTDVAGIVVRAREDTTAEDGQVVGGVDEVGGDCRNVHRQRVDGLTAGEDVGRGPEADVGRCDAAGGIE